MKNQPNFYLLILLFSFITSYVSADPLTFSDKKLTSPNVNSSDSRISKESSYSISVNAAVSYPTLQSNNSSIPTYTQGGTAVQIAPAFTISNAGNIPLSSMKVYFTDGHFSNQDELNFTNQNGITGNWNQSSGVLTLSGTASATTYQNAIRSITYSNLATGSANSGTRKIEYTMGNATAFSGNNHYYEYVAGTLSWQDAKINAESKSYFGLQGYLATITSAQENEFIRVKLAGDGWIGCSDADTENTWKWVTGPEAGTIFWRDGYKISGQYSNWNDKEPNEYPPVGEDYGHIFSSTGRWNDYYHTNSSIQGYVVEYGGSIGDPPVSNLSTSSNVNVVNNRPPVAVNDGPYYVYPGAAITKNVKSNDSDPDGNATSISTWNALSPNIGTIANKQNTGSFNFTAPAATSKNYAQDVSFTYILSDSKATATGNVSIKVVTPTWNGIANYSTSGNWNGSVVPLNNLRNDVIVNSGQVIISDSREIRHLTVNNNAIITVSPTGVLHIYGDLDNKNAGNGKIIIQKGGKIYLHGNYIHNGQQKLANGTTIELNTILEF
ncbi:hypothetical protein EMN47_14245 [Prolixibacteraceae bacterium JC049]|nr:hypothetical protein [Prolixibacteraceae bacterium JC049]